MAKASAVSLVEAQVRCYCLAALELAAAGLVISFSGSIPGSDSNSSSPPLENCRCIAMSKIHEQIPVILTFDLLDAAYDSVVLFKADH